MKELTAIDELARRILSLKPDPAVRIRLLRDVLCLPNDASEMVQARQDVTHSRWVQELEREQWADGGWGRLHSMDTTAQQRIPTTEAGVARTLAVGLDSTHPILQQAAQHLVGLLAGKVQPRDRAEKNDRWPVGVALFAAATLAQIDPGLEDLDSVWGLWKRIAERTFVLGSYDVTAEVRAHQELTGASVRDSYLTMDNRYTLTLLGARATALPQGLEKAILGWVWHKREGIGYLGEWLGARPRGWKPGRLDRWLSSLELLSRYPTWRNVAQDAVDWIWRQQSEDGFWDFGARGAATIALPLSESWRRRDNRRWDWTTRILTLLRRFYAPNPVGANSVRVRVEGYSHLL